MILPCFLPQPVCRKSDYTVYKTGLEVPMPRCLFWFATVSFLWIVAGCAGDGARCGNGKLEKGEECDDGNTFSGDGCSSSCRLESFCGNGVCEYGEVHTCPQDCPVCGNGRCDPGETVASCTIDCYCTNGTCDPGENTSNCPQDCPFVPVCGNGVCEAGESIHSCMVDCYCTNGTCDEGESELTCPQDCSSNPCGNGVCEAFESTSTCSQDCYYGNGTCDQGENQSNCALDCGSSVTCGNGQLDSGEACDGPLFAGNANCISLGYAGGTLACNANCTLNTSGCTTNTSCTIIPQSGCESGQKCTVDTIATNRCITAGPGAEGTPCMADADCQAGMGCAVINGFTFEAACRRFCRAKNAYADSHDCLGSAGSICYYNVADANNNVFTNLFQCTAACDPVAGTGCISGMKCNLYGIDRSGNGQPDLYATECYSTADTNYYCSGGAPCPNGYECFNFGYGPACYRWCSTQNTAVCDALGMACYAFPEQVIIGGVQYGYCDHL